MNVKTVSVVLSGLLVAMVGAASAQVESRVENGVLDPNSRAAIAGGWRPLFDGGDTSQWRGYKAEAFPAKGWAVERGTLKCSSGGGDIITREQFGDFELSLEFMTTTGANSGIMYRVTERHGATWQTGPEFQLIDDSGAGLGAADAHSAGALYDIASPAEGKTLNPPGQWNHARVRLSNGLLQHFLNGTKVVELRVDGDDWKQKIAKSKFASYEGFGVEPRGHIAIQDHGNELSFRNIYVRDLDAPMQSESVLFGEKTDGDWNGFVPGVDGTLHVSPFAIIASMTNGVLTISGKPTGYIYTEGAYDSFVLRLSWRFDPEKGAGNSGVLIRQTGEHKVWPKSVEAQLHSGNAGDFWNIGEFNMKTDPTRTNGRNTKKLAMAERPVGEWNEYEIVADGGHVALWVNGVLCNEAWDVEQIAGPICLQSEGAEIQFKDIRVSPLK